jgi:NAD-dependent deacetylase
MQIVVLSGAGISAESGISTFRDSGGLWENYKIEDVATPNAWQKDKALVLEFYNQRRRQVIHAKPNQAHLAITKLQIKHQVDVITQNVDDLHERAGNASILHLHGEIRKSRSTKNNNLIYKIEGSELNLGDLCELGSQLRPHIVWFGEEVPMLERAAEIISKCDVLIIVGTSLQVYPAANLWNYTPKKSRIILIDPHSSILNIPSRFDVLSEIASAGMQKVLNEYL